MNTNFSEENKYIRAKKRVDNLKGFYSNLISYCIIIPFLIFINLMTNPDYLWFWFPMFGWGIGVCFHAFSVFDYKIGLGKDWENRKIKEFMDTENTKTNNL